MKWLIALLLIPSVLAFDCSDIGTEFCEEITKSSLSYEEKNQLIAASLYSDINNADHSLVENWNKDIQFNEAPIKVDEHNKETIHNAWLKIITVMPSVIDQKLLSPGNGKVLTAFNYKIKVPETTLSGDCKTYHYLESNENSLNVYLNDDYIGNSRLIHFIKDEDMHFRADLLIESTIRRRHYKWKEYCCKREDGYCIEYCKKCRYSHTDYKTDKLTLTDTLVAYYFNPSPKVDFELTNKYHNTLKGIFSVTNSSSSSLVLGEAYLNQYQYDYSLNYSLEPYYVLTLQAIKNPRKEMRNMNIINNEFTVKETTECTIHYSTHFITFDQECDLSLEENELEIKTNKISYIDNETIKIDLFPKDEFIEVNYANLSKTARNNAEFTALFPYNKITAKQGNTEREKIIGIAKKSRLHFLLNLGMFSGILFFVHEILKKYIGVLF